LGGFTCESIHTQQQTGTRNRVITSKCVFSTLGWELRQTIKMYKKVVCLSIVSAVLTQYLFAQEQEKSVRLFTLEALEAAVFPSNP
jgi:hypothetical protein